MKKLVFVIGLLISSAQVYADSLSDSKKAVAQWLGKTDSGLSGDIVSLKQVTLEDGESAYLVELDSLEMSYALARPKLKQAKYLDDLSDDLFRAYNQNDITLIPTEKSTVLVLEGGGSHQGYFMSSRKFMLFNGWEAKILYEGEAESDNTGACGNGEVCQISKTAYKVKTASPLVIVETTTSESGASLDSMGKKKTVNKTVAVQSTAKNAQQTTKSAKNKIADVMNFEVVGVKLGMTESQVVQAIQSNWNISKEKMDIRHPIMGLGAQAQILVGKKNQRLIVNLNFPKVGKRTKTPVVDTIVYEMSATHENQQAMLEKALEKYGEPTGRSGSTSVWCSAIKYPRCDLDTGAGLTLDGTKITVLGPTHETEIREMIRKQKNSKPDF